MFRWTTEFSSTLPDFGSCATTSPGGFVDGTECTTGFRLCDSRSATATDCCWPISFGTSTCGFPVETTSSTVSPLWTWFPGGGDCEMTKPTATVESGCCE